MVVDIRNTGTYRLTIKRIRKLLKAKKVDHISVSTEGKAKLTLYLKEGNPIIYRGKIVAPLRKFIFKNA